MSQKAVPTVAFIGYPNSGKSSLINRICGKKTAIVANEAHTTRDLNIGYEVWEGMYMRFVDTGGLVPEPQDVIQTAVQLRSWSAIAEADLLVWVIDRKTDPDAISEIILHKLWKSGKPFIIAQNKVDDPNIERESWEYARIGALEVISLSTLNGYGINTLLDWIVSFFERLGFEKNNYTLETEVVEKPKRGKKLRRIKMSKEGKIFDYEEMGGTKLFQDTTMHTLVFDVDGVLVTPQEDEIIRLLQGTGITHEEFLSFSEELEKNAHKYVSHSLADAYEKLTGVELLKEHKKQLYRIEDRLNIINPEWIPVLQSLREQGLRLVVGTNYPITSRKNIFLPYFDAYYSPAELKCSKNSTEYFSSLKKYEPNQLFFIDDKSENIIPANKAGIDGVVYDKSNPKQFAQKFLHLSVDGKIKPSRILIIGRPNVGKSTLTNALLGEEKQIVSNVAGTTLSVNEYVIEHQSKQYTLVDTVGVRKAGKRTFGAETFATYRTIEAAHEADVIILVFDATMGITAQDQLVAGIARDTRASVVVVANKVDQLTPDRKQAFLKDFQFKLEFLKVTEFVWFSAEQAVLKNPEYPVDTIWKAVDASVQEVNKPIGREEVRKLFNYLMKQKPPKKLHIKRRPVVYDLQYVSAKPHTFHLIVKDKTTIHWSYVRFLENTIKQQFELKNTPVKIKLVELRNT